MTDKASRTVIVALVLDPDLLFATVFGSWVFWAVKISKTTRDGTLDGCQIARTRASPRVRITT